MSESHESTWIATSLGDLVSFQRGHDLPSSARRPGRVPVIGSGGPTGWHDKAKAKGPGITVGRAANLGTPTLITADFWPLNTTLYVTDFYGNDVHFVYYLLKTLDLTAYNSGSVQPMLNRNYIKKVRLSVPGPVDQRVIAGLFRALDDKIAVNDGIVEVSFELVQTTWKSATVGSVESVKFSDLATIDKGLSYKGEGLGSGEPLVNLANFGVDGRFKADQLKFYSGESRERHWVRDGDLVMANTDLTQRREILGQPAIIAVGSPRAMFSHHVFAVRPKPGYDAELLWLYCALRDSSFRDRAMTFATGTTVASLPRDAVLTYEVPTPSADIRRAWTSLAAPLISESHSCVRQNLRLTEVRDTLLPKLISGEIRVKDAERLVSDAV
jgi:type I restriction enzyme, S subunit